MSITSLPATSLPKVSAASDWRAEGKTRGDDIFQAMQTRLYRRTDYLFAALMLFEWLGGLILAFWVSPRTWSGAMSSVHPHVYAAALIGGALATPVVFAGIFRAGKPGTRYQLAVCQMAMTGLLIHLTGGRIETHFLVFGSLAFLAAYRDWRILIAASAVTAVDHIIRGALWPQSVYGVMNPEVWRWVEHASWVAFEDIVLVIACVQGSAEMRESAQRQGELEASHAFVAAAEATLRLDHVELEGLVHQRTEELHQANINLTAAAQRAEAANHSKSSFLANMSHEIRTPMTAVVGYAEMMLDPQQAPEKRYECVQVIQRNAKHLLELIGDVLDVSKIEAGKMEVERIHCDVAQITVDVVSLCRARAIAKGLTFSLTFSESFPEQIRSDALRIKQILMNLISNAIKFTRSGGIRLHVSLDTTAGDQPRMRFDVSDTGIGISPKEIARLFQPFSQADESTTRNFGGTGLGLIISKRLAELMGGDVVVHSLPGVGSTFSLIIDPGPLEGVTMRQQLQESMLAVNHIAPTHGKIQLKGRILLAEDGPDNQLLIATHLRTAGAEVVVAENGRIAVDEAMAGPFDLIFMDMQMPELDGYGATRELRKLGWNGPIVAITAHALSGEREKCIDAGCTDYCTKPIERSLLIRTAATYLKDSITIDETSITPSEALTGSAAAGTGPASACLRSAFAEDADMSEVLLDFVARLPSQVARLEEFARDGQAKELGRLVHQIKGAGGGFGFPSMTELAAQAELSIKASESAENIRKDVDELIELIRRVEGYDPKKERSSAV